MSFTLAPGVMLRLLAAFLVTAMSALIHALASEVPLGQIIFWRSFVAILPICLYAATKGNFPRALATRRPLLHLTRGSLGVLAMALSFLSLTYLPVADAMALSYLAPVLTLPMAALALGERLTPRILLAVAAGFGGVIAMLWEALALPGGGAMIGVAAGLGFAVLMAAVRVFIKSMTATETPAAIALYFAVAGSIAGLASLPFGWADLPLRDFALLAAAGLLGGLGHVASTEAVARAPVSAVAPFDFTGLVWALGFDVLIFGTVPGPLGTLGVGLITLAALLVTFAPAERRTAGGSA